MGSNMLKREIFKGEGLNIIDLMVTMPNFFPTRAEAKKSIMSGGFFINNKKITDIEMRININDLEGLFGDGSDRWLVCRKGKNVFTIGVEPWEMSIKS